ncbi:hypothetical protein J6TS7_46980 [Paenibacillus dendritiformis]|nr:hypothetical protein J6TS7_46980 [Paenibacillus dendritiformis]
MTPRLGESYTAFIGERDYEWLGRTEAIQLGDRVQPLPDDGRVPHLPDWRVIPTPGHTPGHVSLYRESDRTLIAGDAFITVKQESALHVIGQAKEIHGPPAYFTPDWDEAWRSVKRLKSCGRSWP